MQSRMSHRSGSGELSSNGSALGKAPTASVLPLA